MAIPFKVSSASEKNAQYRAFVHANNAGLVKSMYNDIDEQVLAACRRKKSQGHGQDDPTDFLLTGSPCNPFSIMRCKRYRSGNVVGHDDYGITQTSVLQMYKLFTPKVGISEQVPGFDRPTSSNDMVTPKEKFLETTCSLSVRE